MSEQFSVELGSPSGSDTFSRVVFSVPHCSTVIDSVVRRDQFCIDEDTLQLAIATLTDWHTDRLFIEGVPADAVVLANASRLVVDVERFRRNDPLEAIGNGSVYTHVSRDMPLRRPLSAAEHENLLAAYYDPYHAELSAKVTQRLVRFKGCLIFDCHSYPVNPLFYESNPESSRPDVCIGYDARGATAEIAEVLCERFTSAGLTVKRNLPFSGSLLPLEFISEPRVVSAMIEIRRDLYMDEATSALSPDFEAVARCIRQACIAAEVAFGEIVDQFSA